MVDEWVDGGWVGRCMNGWMDILVVSYMDRWVVVKSGDLPVCHQPVIWLLEGQLDSLG